MSKQESPSLGGETVELTPQLLEAALNQFFKQSVYVEPFGSTEAGAKSDRIAAYTLSDALYDVVVLAAGRQPDNFAQIRAEFEAAVIGRQDVQSALTQHQAEADRQNLFKRAA